MPPSRLTPTSPASAGLRATPAPRPPPPPPSSRQCGDKAEHTHTGATRVHTRPHTRAHTHKHGESHWRAHSEIHTHTHTRHRLQPQAKPLVQAHTLIQMYTLLHIGTHPLQAPTWISTSRHTQRPSSRLTHHPAPRSTPLHRCTRAYTPNNHLYRSTDTRVFTLNAHPETGTPTHVPAKTRIKARGSGHARPPVLEARDAATACAVSAPC